MKPSEENILDIHKKEARKMFDSYFVKDTDKTAHETLAKCIQYCENKISKTKFAEQYDIYFPPYNKQCKEWWMEIIRSLNELKKPIK